MSFCSWPDGHVTPDNYNPQHSINWKTESVFSAEFILPDKNDDFEQTDFTTGFIFMNYKQSSVKGHLLLDITVQLPNPSLICLPKYLGFRWQSLAYKINCPYNLRFSFFEWKIKLSCARQKWVFWYVQTVKARISLQSD